jgi:hypothetical protein
LSLSQRVSYYRYLSRHRSDHRIVATKQPRPPASPVLSADENEDEDEDETPAPTPARRDRAKPSRGGKNTGAPRKTPVTSPKPLKTKTKSRWGWEPNKALRAKAAREAPVKLKKNGEPFKKRRLRPGSKLSRCVITRKVLTSTSGRSPRDPEVSEVL